jgi:hypothetical protein
MSKRKNAKAMTLWCDQARRWAWVTGRDLALDLFYNRETSFRPYEVGVGLDAGEKVWAEVPVRFNLDWRPPGNATQITQSAVRPWLVTSDRVVGRLGDDRLRGYRWEHAIGTRVDLTPGYEVVGLDIEGEPTLLWSGPTVAPLAVAAIFQLYGPIGIIEHPGLEMLRVGPDCLH